MTMFARLTQQGNTHLALSILRVWSGAMMMYHGSSKVFGNPTDFVSFVTTKLQMPEVFAWAAMGAELVGGLLLCLGLLTRVAALGVIATMMVAVFEVHMNDPWMKKEFALFYLIAGVVFLIAGGGRYSLDTIISRRDNNENRNRK